MAEWLVVKHVPATTHLHAFCGSGGDEAELAHRQQEMISVGTFGADRDLTVVPTTRRTQEL